MKRNMLIVLGPTGVGKTECTDTITSAFSSEVINGDMGQMYVPFTVGTAKPDWQRAAASHHLFDIIDKPESYSVIEYRKKVQENLSTIWGKQRVPIVIGGSSFYIASLLFPPVSYDVSSEPFDYSHIPNLWQHLHSIDPDRAVRINPADTYRITRALTIWYRAGKKPSLCVPNYDPIAENYCLLWITRDREDLYDRINRRVHCMIEQGWIDEVQRLRGTAWEEFIKRKKLIGYSEIVAYLDGVCTYNTLIATIQCRTRSYAKRQISFWRMLSKKIELQRVKNRGLLFGKIDTINLTKTDIGRYIDQLKQTMSPALDEKIHEF